METFILELSQTKAEKVFNNGDFICELSKPILMSQNDSIQVKNVFLDTTAQTSGNIVLENDITLEIQNGFYINNYETTNRAYVNTTIQQHPDGMNYIACLNSKNSGSGVVLDELVSIEFGYSGEGGETWGGYDAIYSYTDPLGNTNQKIHVHCPFENKDRTSTHTTNVGLIYIQGSLKLLNPSDFDPKKNADTIIQQTNTQSAGTIELMTPIIKKSEYIIEKGQYSPQDMATLLSEKFSSLTNSQYFTHPVESNFLSGDEQLGPRPPHPLDLTQYGKVYFVQEYNGSTDPADILFFNNSNTYVGTNQFELSYSVETETFSFDYIHFPIYDSTKGENISTIYKEKGTTGQYFNTSKHSGIFFTSLTATDNTTNQPIRFWDNILGFDLSTLLTNISQRKQVAIPPYTGYIPLIELNNGLNTTEGLKTLDSGVKHNSADWEIVPDLSSGLESTIQYTENIEANSQFTDTSPKISHYLIEINSNFVNHFVDADEERTTIQAIINNYYSYASYVASGTESSIPFVFNGTQPQYLKSFKVRILNPDKSLASIGDNNTIYLELTKEVNIPQLEQKK